MQNKIDKITDILRRDDGISGAMHYSEQIRSKSAGYCF